MRLLVLGLIVGAAPAMADVSPFHTPSGNIQCFRGADFGALSDVSCVIAQRSGPPARPKPASCNGPWGHRFMISEAGPVEMQCGGPSGGKPLGDVAGYGQAADYGGGFTCISQKTGFTCQNRDGHGFFLSRKSQTVW